MICSWGMLIVPYPCERGPTTEYQPIPHFGLNFLLRPNVYSNMHPCVAALENTFMRTELRIVSVRLISNLPNSCKTKPS